MYNLVNKTRFIVDFKILLFQPNLVLSCFLLSTRKLYSPFLN